MRELTVVIDDAMTASAPLVNIATDLGPDGLKPHDGVLPIEAISRAAAEITGVAEELTALSAQLGAVSTDGTVQQLQEAKATLVEAIDPAAAALTDAAPVVRALPAMLGADGPRHYVVMFLNNAELRSLGGTALSFAEVSVDKGAITLGRVIPTSGGDFVTHPAPVIPVPDGFDAVLPGVFGRFVANATLRPSAVTAAEIVQAEWRATYGDELDGVISMDGGALRLLLGAVGPVTISTGDVVGADNVLSLLFNEVYIRYDSGVRAVDDAQQGLVYAETVAGTFARLTSGQFELRGLVDAMSTAAEARGLSVWFADPAEREALAATPFVAGDLPESTATTDAVGVYLNGLVGSKLDYYLRSTVTTGSAVCTADGRQVHRVTLDLTNSLDPAPLPASAGRSPAAPTRRSTWRRAPSGSRCSSTSRRARRCSRRRSTAHRSRPRAAGLRPPGPGRLAGGRPRRRPSGEHRRPGGRARDPRRSRSPSPRPSRDASVEAPLECEAVALP